MPKEWSCKSKGTMACPATPTDVILYSMGHFGVPDMSHSPKPTSQCLCRYLANTCSYVPEPSYGSCQGGSRAIPAEYLLAQERVSKHMCPRTHNRPGNSVCRGFTVSGQPSSRSRTTWANTRSLWVHSRTVKEVIGVVSNYSRVRTMSAGTGESSRNPRAVASTYSRRSHGRFPIDTVCYRCNQLESQPSAGLLVKTSPEQPQ